MKGTLYLADRDGSTGPDVKGVAVIRKFTLATGEPAGETPVPAVEWFNDIAVTDDGTVYATVTGGAQETDVATWQVWRIRPDGTASPIVQGAPLRRPNGIAIDGDGNLVVVNMLTPDVQTYSPDGKLLKTEQAAQPGNDGIVILRDGTKYVSSVMNGGVSRIRPGQPATLVASNIPNAASMCYDAGANQLVIPMNANNALAFVKLQ
jgi:sugar lactone lactonase YvrE